MRLGLFVAALLTAVAGYVDAIGYLLFAKVYTANMSGNSVAIGIGLGQTDWAKALFRLWPVTLYVIGIFFGRVMIEAAARARFRRIASVAFVLEGTLLLITAHTSAILELSIALLAFSMGMQNAVLTHFSSLTLHTGFVTGTLVKMSEQAVKFATWLWDGGWRQGWTASWQQNSCRTAIWLLLIWLAYVSGAAGGAFATGLWHITALLAATAGLAVLLAIDMLRPLAIQDEQEQDPSRGNALRRA